MQSKLFSTCLMWSLIMCDEFLDSLTLCMMVAPAQQKADVGSSVAPGTISTAGGSAIKSGIGSSALKQGWAGTCR